MITRPIPPKSPEWKSTAGQDAILKEMAEHQRKGTWLLETVRELDDVVAETQRNGVDAITGGVP